MLEPQKNTSQRGKLAMTVNQKELAWAILAIVVRYVIVPAVVIFASTLLSSINSTLAQLSEKVNEANRLALQTRAESESYRLVVDKQLELLDYRITLLEGVYGRIGRVYPELLGEHTAGPTGNASALGEHTNK